MDREIEAVHGSHPLKYQLGGKSPGRSGLPLGLSAIKFWTRERFKGANELKRHVNPTRVPIEEKESVRWLECQRRLKTDPPRPSVAEVKLTHPGT